MNSRLPNIILLGLLIIITCLVLKYKLTVLFYHGYTSDIFTYDQAMQEGIKGYLGLEYTYGNLLGDHANWFAVILYPVKALLRQHMVVLLVLLGPFSFAGSTYLLWRTLRNKGGAAAAAALCTIPYVVTLNILTGLFEPTYGFHPDTLSGFLAVAFTATLIERRRRLNSGQPTQKTTIGFIALLIAFMSLKEEMTVLAIFYFVILLAFEHRDRFYIKTILSTLVILIAQFWVTGLLATPWNRTDAVLLRGLIQRAQSDGILHMLFGPLTYHYWSVVTVSLLLASFPFLLTPVRNRFAIALGATGVVKLALGLLVAKDVVPATWHNFPGLVMLSGACALQLYELFLAQNFDTSPTGPATSQPKALAAVAAVIGISCWSATDKELPKAASIISKQTLNIAPETRALLKKRATALVQIKQQMNPAKVISLNGYTAVDWCDGYRYTFFGRGVTESPVAIADYIIADKLFPITNMSTYLNEPAARREFELKAQNEFFELWQRKAVDPEHRTSRRNFVARYGIEAIGGGIPNETTTP